MCDIYMAKCSGRGCKTEVDMHLADYDTDRDEVRVFCGEHLPKGNRRGWRWSYRDYNSERWQKVFVEALTDNAWRNREGNHPNAMMLLRRPAGTLEVDKGKGCSAKVAGRNRRSGTAALQKGKVGG